MSRSDVHLICINLRTRNSTGGPTSLVDTLFPLISKRVMYCCSQSTHPRINAVARGVLDTDCDTAAAADDEADAELDNDEDDDEAEPLLGPPYSSIS